LRVIKENSTSKASPAQPSTALSAHISQR